MNQTNVRVKTFIRFSSVDQEEEKRALLLDTFNLHV